jgi:hypothetical protein
MPHHTRTQARIPQPYPQRTCPTQHALTVVAAPCGVKTLNVTVNIGLTQLDHKAGVELMQHDIIIIIIIIIIMGPEATEGPRRTQKALVVPASTFS